jgi:hypothetical protein
MRTREKTLWLVETPLGVVALISLVLLIPICLIEGMIILKNIIKTHVILCDV